MSCDGHYVLAHPAGLGDWAHICHRSDNCLLISPIWGSHKRNCCISGEDIFIIDLFEDFFYTDLENPDWYIFLLPVLYVKSFKNFIKGSSLETSLVI